VLLRRPDLPRHHQYEALARCPENKSFGETPGDLMPGDPPTQGKPMKVFLLRRTSTSFDSKK